MVAYKHLLPLILATTPAWAGSDIAGPVDAVVERVVDGDTVRVSARIWVDQYVSVSVRLKDVDAPELFRPQCPAEKEKAQAAKDFVEGMLGAGAVTLRDITHDKYGGRVAARRIFRPHQAMMSATRSSPKGSPLRRAMTIPGAHKDLPSGHG